MAAPTVVTLPADGFGVNMGNGSRKAYPTPPILMEVVTAGMDGRVGACV